MAAEQREIAQLKKALKEAEIERDILKKAVSIFSRFMKDHHTYLLSGRCAGSLRCPEAATAIG